ncbi:BspA family leucine-rich repeat surface protein [Mesonia sp.]|uniref:BspA family leucine-rich repeat surface protein n=1 Tax=Mesonia sp. TaxID=1960830 RepID=UPI003F9C4F2C
MKKNYLILIAVLVSYIVDAQNQPFITTWEVDMTYGLDITIPTEGTGYDYTIDFGDGSILNNQTGDTSHTYASPGTYTVSITGDFPRIYFTGSTAFMTRKIKSVEQWGDIQWQSMAGAFSFCMYLEINATDVPDLSQVTDISRMFSGDGMTMNAPLNNWDVSNVIDMNSMFNGAIDFNQPLNNWDVSNVTNMKGMFGHASSFNQDISNWDVSNVTDMTGMFAGANVFDQPLNNWDVSNVTSMGDELGYIIGYGGMFEAANAFNQDLSNWNVSNVQNFGSMFASADAFNQDLSSWDVSSATTMARMFDLAISFNQSVNTWDVSNVTNMSNMFGRNPAFNQSLSNWDVSSVTDMTRMFFEATAFNQNISSWDVTNVEFMGGMFADASAFNQDISTWMFNTNLSFDVYNDIGFLENCGLDVQNYDMLLAQFASLNLNDKALGADGLEYCNALTRDYLINTLGWTISGDQVSPSCGNYIEGQLLYDQNNNGCDSNDVEVTGFMVNANNGSIDWQTFSNQGNYEIGAIGTSFSVSVMNYPSYYSVSPASTNVVFTTNNTEAADFCITPNQNVEDLKIILLPINQPRPGFEANYKLIVENMGTQTVANAIVTLNFDHTMQSFVTASGTPTSTTANQLTFDIGNIQPLTFQTIDFAMQTFQPPTVSGDDVLSFTANVNLSANDFTPNDNTFIYDQIVVNSYDPNDKQVLQGEEIEIGEVDEYLNYLIRFQNTGTASAVNVKILDTLHPKLDYNTLKPVNASHDYRVQIKNGNQVEFIFNDINLPDENTNEPASHGFLAYKIKPKNDVAIGDFITGDASIYFDFNAPIITNTVSTEVIDNLSVNSKSIENNISVYPNPVKDVLRIRTKNGVEVEELSVYNIQGRKILFREENIETLKLENLSSGIYLLNIKTNQGEINQQLVKK